MLVRCPPAEIAPLTFSAPAPSGGPRFQRPLTMKTPLLAKPTHSQRRSWYPPSPGASVTECYEMRRCAIVTRVAISAGQPGRSCYPWIDPRACTCPLKLTTGWPVLEEVRGAAALVDLPSGKELTPTPPSPPAGQRSTTEEHAHQVNV
jgi:hypothetical protein